ncbi:MAG: protease pro-enzyme activation domain-containing protein [Streptosporangiaceae bacterium]
MGTRRRPSLVAAGAAALLGLTTISGVAAAQPAGAATASRHPLAGSLIPAAARQHPAGAVAKSARVDFELILKLRDASGAQSLVRSVSTPGSASYRHYLTAAQWEARFSPAASEVRSAREWLASEGFTVGAVSRDRITISASGTAGQVERAFGTGLENYRLNGHPVRLATRKMSVPASISRSVIGAMGINQSIATPTDAAGTAVSTRTSALAATNPFPPAPPAFITANPCGSYYGAKTTAVTPPFGHGYPRTVPDTVCGYKPGQFRSAYQVGPATSGKGVTVAIVDAYGSSTIASDATRYFQQNDPGNPFANAHFTQLNATPFDDQTECAASSWLDEQAIDVESVHSMAPNAHILYVGAQDCINGLFSSEQDVIDNGLANVVTNSWGDDAGDLLDDVATRTAYDDLFMLADSTGMTILFSSGDNGDNFNLFGLSSADYPPSSPYVTGVGGTSLKIGASGQQTGQLGWATGRAFKCTANIEGDIPGCTASTVNTWLPVAYDGGSGGFTSYNYTQPFYQAGVVPSALALRNQALDGSSLMRVVPDISLDADPATGFLIGLHEIFPNGKDEYGQTRYGGTSLASPLLAGVIADADQAAGTPAGFINPAIYRLDRKAGAIDDILPGGNQAEYRVDHAFTYVTGAKGDIQSFRELTYEGVITYCDGTGNCATRPNTLSTAKGYDSMTGLGSIGPGFIPDLANF